MRKFKGNAAVLMGVGYAAFVCWSIYGAIVPIETHTFRMVHVAFIFGLAFLAHPICPNAGRGWMWADTALAALGVATIVYPLTHLDFFLRESTLPGPLDVFFGIVAILMLLELSAVWKGANDMTPATAVNQVTPDAFNFCTPARRHISRSRAC
jgi:TRAP-type uncharacterized transport system fused permease subunit